MKSYNTSFARPLSALAGCGARATDGCQFRDRAAGLGGIKILRALIATALASAPFAAHAIEAKVSGQINRALLSVDDGTQTETQNVDNHTSSTRFRFTGSAEMVPGVTAGVVFENEFESNPSNKVTQTVKSVAPTLGERHANVYFEGGFGYVSLGQGDGAANGGTEVDLSGTDVVQGALATSAIGGAISFRNSTVMGPTIGATTDNQDFESRYDRLRYDTPAFGPLKVTLDTGISGSQDVKEVALDYSSGMGGGKLAGTIGSSKKDADPNVVGSFDQTTTGGSISWLSGSGLNLTLSTSSKDVATGPSRKGKFNYLKVGYKTGQHAFSVDYGKAKDEAAAGDEAKVMGVAWVYSPIKWAQIYAAAETHKLDRSGTNFDDIRILVLGSRLKF